MHLCSQLGGCVNPQSHGFSRDSHRECSFSTSLSVLWPISQELTFSAIEMSSFYIKYNLLFLLTLHFLPGCYGLNSNVFWAVSNYVRINFKKFAAKMHLDTRHCELELSLYTVLGCYVTVAWTWELSIRLLNSKFKINAVFSKLCCCEE